MNVDIQLDAFFAVKPEKLFLRWKENLINANALRLTKSREGTPCNWAKAISILYQVCSVAKSFTQERHLSQRFLKQNNALKRTVT